MPVLERSNPLPLYYQLKEVLKQQIISGHLAPHTAIPSEPELVGSYRVSRATVRQALSELVHEGLLYREHGKGTFVCEPRVQQTLSELTSFTEEMRRRGKRPGSIVLVSELVRGSHAMRERLRLVDAEQAIRLERLRTADGTPIAHQISYLPYPQAEGVYQKVKELADGSLYALMAAEGLRPYVAEQTLKVDEASVRESELLYIQPKEAGLRLISTTFDQTGTPVEYSESFYAAGRYEFQVTLRVAR
jgi:GntR family transcriptional regulator